MKNKLVSFIGILILFLFLAFIKISDYILFNQYLGRVGENYIYLLIALVILFFLTRLNTKFILEMKISNYLDLLKGLLFIIPFYFLALYIEYIYNSSLYKSVKIGFLPKSFRITFPGSYKILALRLILIIVFAIIIALVEEAYFRYIFIKGLKGLMPDFLLYFSVSFLFALWSILDVAKEYSLVYKRDIKEVALCFLVGFLISLRRTLNADSSLGLWFAFGDNMATYLLFNFFHVIGKTKMDTYIYIRYIIIATLPLAVIFIYRTIKGRKVKVVENTNKVPNVNKAMGK